MSQGLCGTVYTQLSDVEDETNGLLTGDRRVLKVLPEELSDIAPMLMEAVGGSQGSGTGSPSSSAFSSFPSGS